MASNQVGNQPPKGLRLRRLRRRVLNIKVVWYVISLLVALTMVISLLLPAFVS